MNTYKKIASAIAASVLASCSLPHYATQSGKPEITTNGPREAVIDRITRACVNNGYLVAKADGYVVDCRHLVYKIEERAVFNIIENPPGFKVVMTVMNVKYLGSAREVSDDNTLFPWKRPQALQKELGFPGPVKN
jgi:hypothetical protein